MSTLPQADSIGPVDIAVLLFEGNDFSGDVAPALAQLQDEGTIRVIDLAFVRKNSDGSTSSVEVEDADVAEAYERVRPSQMDLLNDEDLAQVADDLEPGSSALVVVFDNAWAARMAAAIRQSHGTLVALERVPRESVLKALAALQEE
ncbi:DUF6325 family protein [Oryzihumus leptocrescens]|uniref:DUF1269 domain-containing protein n=1 Tax=Oryzihumus leptocrescens TaxID=297536 RepID=A0A542ZFA0_9MICO|nr:DUF6325 family protein [Oryzihumus leptocrescens]TQL59004.1 hypothetical protein FB474_0348 [Oryzihumus leptocrescens]